MILNQVSADGLPSTPYFSHISSIVQALNGYRLNGTALKEDFEEMVAVRTITESLNGDSYGSYLCLDKWDYIKDNDEGTSRY